MPCDGCGSGKRRKLHGNLPMDEQPERTWTGVYDLITATTTTPYYGRFRQLSVRVVGFRTEYERVFKYVEGRAARHYMQTADPAGQLRMFSCPANHIPHDVGLALFGA